MKEVNTEPAEQGLIESILAEARSQADALAAEAEAAAKGILDQSRGEAESLGIEIQAKAAKDARVLIDRECAKARVEVRRVLRRAREEAVNKVLGRIEKALGEIRGDAPRYRALMTGLLAEAVVGTGSREVIALVAAADREVVDEPLLEEVRKRVGDLGGNNVTIRVQFEDADLGGGCIGLEPGGRVRLDNTFPRRLKEIRRQLRLLISAEIEKNCG